MTRKTRRGPHRRRPHHRGAAREGSEGPADLRRPSGDEPHRTGLRRRGDARGDAGPRVQRPVRRLTTSSRTCRTPSSAPSPRSWSRSYKVVPIRMDGKVLQLAMMDPKNLMALDEISFVTGYKIDPWVAPEIRIFQVLEKYYNIPRSQRYITLARELSRLRSRGEKIRPPGQSAPRPDAPEIPAPDAGIASMIERPPRSPARPRRRTSLRRSPPRRRLADRRIRGRSTVTASRGASSRSDGEEGAPGDRRQRRGPRARRAGALHGAGSLCGAGAGRGGEATRRVHDPRRGGRDGSRLRRPILPAPGLLHPPRRQRRRLGRLG